MKKIIIGLLLLYCLGLFALPGMITYQGKLTSTSNIGINDTVDIVFRIYDDLSAGSVLYADTLEDVVVSKGLFDARFEIDLTRDELSEDIFLELDIDGHALVPRQLITPEILSLKAIYADSSLHAENATYSDTADVAYYTVGVSWDTLDNYVSIWGDTIKGDMIHTSGHRSVWFDNDNSDSMWIYHDGDTAHLTSTSVVKFCMHSLIVDTSGEIITTHGLTVRDTLNLWDGLTLGGEFKSQWPTWVDSAGYAETWERYIDSVQFVTYVDSVRYIDSLTYAAMAGNCDSIGGIPSNVIIAMDTINVGTLGMMSPSTEAFTARVYAAGEDITNKALEVKGRSEFIGDINLNGGIDDGSGLGAPGQVLKSDGTNVFWASSDSVWTQEGNILYLNGKWGLSRPDNILYGLNDSTHINLGLSSTTGSLGMDYEFCTVSGGKGNVAGGMNATVGGGDGNRANGNNTFIGGGYHNQANNQGGTVCGGTSNVTNNDFASIGGGNLNEANGYYSVVCGGKDNIAEGQGSIVLGGYGNEVIGNYSMAYGYGNFVSDNYIVSLYNPSHPGKVGINTNAPTAELDVGGNAAIQGDLHLSGKVTQDEHANSTLPIAYGFINMDGTVESSTTNVTAIWDSATSSYQIEILGETYVEGNYVTTITPSNRESITYSTSSSSGKLVVTFIGGAGPTQSAFQFVTYKP